jgi:hypothetical protein
MNIFEDFLAIEPPTQTFTEDFAILAGHSNYELVGNSAAIHLYRALNADAVLRETVINTVLPPPTSLEDGGVVENMGEVFLAFHIEELGDGDAVLTLYVKQNEVVIIPLDHFHENVFILMKQKP